MRSSAKRNLGFGLRLALGLALLTLVVRRLDSAELFRSLAGLSWLPLVLAIAAQGAQRCLWAFRWQAILGANGIRRRLGDLLALVMIGLFFNSFFPTAVGGDVVRGYYAARGRERMLTSYLVVAIERLLGMISFALFAAVPSTLALLGNDQRFPRQLLGFAAAIGWTVVVGGIVVFSWRGWRSWVAGLPLLRGLAEKAGRGLDLFRQPETPRLLVVGSSLGLKLLAVLFYIGCARAVGIDTPALLFFLIVPATIVASMLPITLNGLGVREGVFVALLATTGVPTAQGGAAALLTLVVSTAFSLVGGAIYPFYRASRETEPA